MKTLAERPLLFLLAAIQFTHMTDFMMIMPLGPQLMRELGIGPGEFASLVSAYTITSGVVTLCLAPIIDRFDRRTLLLWVYAGFAGGTLACALSNAYPTLLLSRAVCGAFGGVAASLVMATVSDIVPPKRRAAGMGIVMTAFAAAAALGVPFGLILAQRYEWETPFFVLAAVALLLWILVQVGMPPVRGHLQPGGVGVWRGFWNLVRDPNAGRGLMFAVSLVFGQFIIIPFLSPYLVANMGLPEKQLTLVYLVGGVLTAFTAPTVGRLADLHGRQRIFTYLVCMACLVTLVLTNAGPMPSWLILTVCGMFFVFGSGRFGPGQAILSLAVRPHQRGAFMSLNSCTRDLASGVSTSIGGWVVSQAPDGRLIHYNWLGWMAVAASVLSLWLAHRVQASEVEAVPATG
jgi:predicted MFS family arabinose efflux permease